MRWMRDCEVGRKGGRRVSIRREGRKRGDSHLSKNQKLKGRNSRSRSRSFESSESETTVRVSQKDSSVHFGSIEDRVTDEIKSKPRSSAKGSVSNASRLLLLLLSCSLLQGKKKLTP